MSEGFQVFLIMLDVVKSQSWLMLRLETAKIFAY
jgi:hypothetical protein